MSYADIALVASINSAKRRMAKYCSKNGPCENCNQQEMDGFCCVVNAVNALGKIQDNVNFSQESISKISKAEWLKIVKEVYK